MHIHMYTYRASNRNLRYQKSCCMKLLLFPLKFNVLECTCMYWICFNSSINVMLFWYLHDNQIKNVFMLCTSTSRVKRIQWKRYIRVYRFVNYLRFGTCLEALYDRFNACQTLPLYTVKKGCSRWLCLGITCLLPW